MQQIGVDFSKGKIVIAPRQPNWRRITEKLKEEERKRKNRRNLEKKENVKNNL